MNDECRLIAIDELHKRILITTNNEEKTINTYIRFYNYTKQQSYDISEDKTYTSLKLHTSLPKWMQKKYHDIYSIVTSEPYYLFKYISLIFYIENPDYLYIINMPTEVQYVYGVNYTQDGLKFISTYDMIQIKNRLKDTHKQFTSMFKECNDLNKLINNPSNKTYEMLSKHPAYRQHLFDHTCTLINIGDLI